MLKVGDLSAPAGTVTDAGGVAAGFPLDSTTTAPPGGAGPFRVTVLAVVVPLPVTDVGDSVSLLRARGTIVAVSVLVVPAYFAEKVTGVFAVTGVVEIAKVGEFAVPSATMTVAGVMATGFELLSVTARPPGGAHPFSATQLPVSG
jgi:hypothetical protein